MNVIRILYSIATIVEFAKSSAEADNGSMLAESLSESKHIVRGSGKETGNKEETSSVNQSAKRMLEAGTKRLLKLKLFNDDCCDDDNDVDEEKKFVASDGSDYDLFGASCSMSDDLVVIGAPGVDEDRGAAYLFHLDGTEVSKLTPGDDGEINDYFGWSVSMDEKIVVGTLNGGYVQVFSRQGTYERTIRCDDCSEFGGSVATLGDLIVTNGEQNSTNVTNGEQNSTNVTNGEQSSTNKLFIYSTAGEFIKSFEQEYGINDVAISEQFISSTSSHWDAKTFIYSNSSPDFPKIAEIYQDGYRVAVSNDRIVIGDKYADCHGVAYLFKTDGTLVTALDRQGTSSESRFGTSVAITDSKILVSAPKDYDQGEDAGSVLIYSAVTGEFIQKIPAPDGESYDRFGSSVCASDSYFVVGAEGDDNGTGAAYLFRFSEE